MLSEKKLSRDGMRDQRQEVKDKLRCFRENTLAKTPEGQETIKLYYEWSPAIVRAIEEDEGLKEEMIDEVLELRGKAE